jgi:hypothetical protein
LDQEDIAAANRFLYLYIQLTVGEAFANLGAIRHPQVGSNFTGECWIRGAAKQAKTSGVVLQLFLLGSGSGEKTCHDARA